MDDELISTLWSLLLLAAALLPSILQIKKKRELARRKSGRAESNGFRVRNHPADAG